MAGLAGGGGGSEVRGVLLIGMCQWVCEGQGMRVMRMPSQQQHQGGGARVLEDGRGGSVQR
jgi:hypothetical protein